MPILLLPTEVASQIAAGEVVERPASVVKELLENALDAGAQTIRIQIGEAGKRLIEVGDDGCGIEQSELRLSVARHATSKLRTAEDLFHIHTLGFRGEALASIGSVSRLTITSRPANQVVGARLRVEGGVVSEVQSVGAPSGSLVRVEDLFYNVPARLKFLKQDQTERRFMDNLVMRYALAYPSVHFSQAHDGRISLQTSGNGDQRECLAALYGVEIARQMIEVIAEEEGLSLSGFISPPSLTRSNRREILFFVNRRPVQDSALVAALTQAYHTLLMVGRYPLAVIFVELPPEAVDVNVHPTKAEVRFREADAVFRAVQRAVRRALLAHTPVPALDGGLRWSSAPTWESSQHEIDPGWGMAVTDEAVVVSGSGSIASPEFTTSPRVGLLRLVGQIADTYLIAEGPDGLYLIDQHAAHERVLYEQMMKQRAESRQAGRQMDMIPAQALLEPVVVELTPGSAHLLEAQLPVLGSLGFQVELFGRGAFLVRSVPVLLGGMDPALALRALVEEFEEDETPLQAEVEAKLIARICKRAAVKAGQRLPPEQQRVLLNDLEACLSPRTCPHGRPTMIHLPVDLLERQFGRKGAR